MTTVMKTDQGEQLKIYSLGFKKLDEAFTLWVAEDLSDLYRKQLLLELSLATLSATVMFFIIWLQRRVISAGFRLLKPFQERLARGDFAEGVELPQQTPIEIASLVNALKKVLSRSAAQIARSRTGLGNLAHELKRPVQKLHWLADDANQPELTASLREAADELEHIMNRELKRARISGNPTPGRFFNPKVDLEYLMPVLDRMCDGQVAIQADLPNMTLPFDRDDLVELVGNLLDNATRYAVSKVHLNIIQHEQADYWSIIIDDDGPGVSPENRIALSARGMRLDENSSHQGSGLGVAICMEIAHSVGGSISFEDSPLKGLRVNVKLPV